MGGKKSTKKPGSDQKPKKKPSPKKLEQRQAHKPVKLTIPPTLEESIEKAALILQSIGSPVTPEDLLALHETRQIQLSYIPKDSDPADTKHAKMRMLRALERTLGIVTSAAKAAGIHRSTHHEWMVTDENYRIFVEGIQETDLDHTETMLRKNIREGKETSIIFHLKTKGKKRGYIETTHTMITEEAPMKITREVVHRTIDVPHTPAE